MSDTPRDWYQVAEQLENEIARLTAEQIETEKQLTDELVNQKIGRLRAEADLAAARELLEALSRGAWYDGTYRVQKEQYEAALQAFSRLGEKP